MNYLHCSYKQLLEVLNEGTIFNDNGQMSHDGGEEARNARINMINSLVYRFGYISKMDDDSFENHMLGIAFRIENGDHQLILVANTAVLRDKTLKLSDPDLIPRAMRGPYIRLLDNIDLWMSGDIKTLIEVVPKGFIQVENDEQQ